MTRMSSENPLSEYINGLAEEIAQYCREHTNIAKPEVTISIKDKEW